jgi:hypothetical protein
MANSKFFEIIGSFSPEEKKEFPLFLNNSFFLRKGNADMLRLFKYFLVAIVSSTDKTLCKSAIHAAIFPSKAFSASRINRLLAIFSELLEQYILTKYYQRDMNNRQRMLDLAGVFRTRMLKDSYNKQLLELKKEAAEVTLESSDHYFFQYQVAKENHEWQSAFNTEKGDLGIPKVIRNLDLFNLNERTELLNQLLLQQKVTKVDSLTLSQLMLEPHNQLNHYEDQSTLLLIRRKIQALLSHTEPQVNDFETLVGLIKSCEKYLSSESVQVVFAYLRNYCSFLINSGHSEMHEVLHTIQKDNLVRGYFYYNGYIMPQALINIILISLSVKNIPWAKQTLELNRDKILAEPEFGNSYQLMLAVCLFEEKKYDEALQNILFDFSIISFMLLAKRLELKIYYETQSDLLPYKIDSFRKYLERNTPKAGVTGTWKVHFHFVNILLQLYQSNANDPNRSLRIIHRINAKKAVADRTWLLEKAKSMHRNG